MGNGWPCNVMHCNNISSRESISYSFKDCKVLPVMSLTYLASSVSSTKLLFSCCATVILRHF